MSAKTSSPILSVVRLPSQGPWPTDDPFLFAVHHDDNFPAGNAELGPNESLRGRSIGSDFGNKDGWNMYHGEVVPGFPKHPHRGFETVTIARSGFVDHSDSLGAAGRFGEGDVQWMTAGKGISHSEMFPLLNQKGRNRIELFQIWMNLPARNKMVEPFFTMLWADQIPRLNLDDGGVSVAVVSGSVGGTSPELPPACPPNSWAAQPGSHVGIVTIKLDPGKSWTLPACPGGAGVGLRRSLYFFTGSRASIGDQSVGARVKVEADPGADLLLTNTGNEAAEFLVLEGKPIGEPVVQHGPFVMNSRDQIMQVSAAQARGESIVHGVCVCARVRVLFFARAVSQIQQSRTRTPRRCCIGLTAKN